MSIGDKIESHIYTYIVGELKNYPVNKTLIDGWEDERQGILDSGGKALDLAGDRRPQNKNSNPVEAKALRLERQARIVDLAKMSNRAIDDVLGLLDPLDRRLVELKFFQPYYTNDGVARELKISLRDFYRRRNTIIEQFGRRMGLL